jgi:uncharacterized protein YgiM (DUF1202 family)
MTQQPSDAFPDFAGIDEAGPVATTKVSLGNLRSSPSIAGAVLGLLKKGEEVELLGQEERWYFVRRADGLTAYAHENLFVDTRLAAQPVKAEPHVAEKVKTEFFLDAFQGNVRRGPTRSADVLFMLKRNDIVSVLEKQGAWYLIDSEDGRRGWAHRSLFQRAAILESNRKP